MKINSINNKSVKAAIKSRQNIPFQKKSPKKAVKTAAAVLSALAIAGCVNKASITYNQTKTMQEKDVEYAVEYQDMAYDDKDKARFLYDVAKAMSDEILALVPKDKNTESTSVLENGRECIYNFSDDGELLSSKVWLVTPYERDDGYCYYLEFYYDNNKPCKISYTKIAPGDCCTDEINLDENDSITQYQQDYSHSLPEYNMLTTLTFEEGLISNYNICVNEKFIDSKREYNLDFFDEELASFEIENKTSEDELLNSTYLKFKDGKVTEYDKIGNYSSFE